MSAELSPLKTSLSEASKKSLGLAGLLGGVFSFIKRDLLPLTIFFGLSFLMTGALTVMNNEKEEEQQGVFATMMPALANLQNSLGLIQKDVDEIKDTTADTSQTACVQILFKDDTKSKVQPFILKVQ